MSKKREFTDKELADIFEYYKTHNMSDTAKHFNTGTTMIYKLTKKFNIKKSKEQIYMTKQQTQIKNFGSLEAARIHRRKAREDTWIKKYGSLEEYREKQQEKSRQTCLKLYNNVNGGWSEEAKSKRIKTNLAKFGVESSTQSEEVKEKMWKTRIEKYGSISGYYKHIASKTRETCLTKYGVQAPCMLDKCRLSSHKSKSKPNLLFASKLKNKGISFDLEFSLNKYQYDFKISEYLIEINPTITHNSTIGYSNSKPKDKYYHQKKSMNATNNGFRCIHVWDWDSYDEIIDKIINKEYQINIQYEEPREIIVKNKYFGNLIIFDDGSIDINN